MQNMFGRPPDIGKRAAEGMPANVGASINADAVKEAAGIQLGANLPSNEGGAKRFLGREFHFDQALVRQIETVVRNKQNAEQALEVAKGVLTAAKKRLNKLKFEEVRLMKHICTHTKVSSDVRLQLIDKEKGLCRVVG